ncbi:MAG: hypothetical protein Q9160_003743 [Pyrenula sp. 1 TL-2023]
MLDQSCLSPPLQGPILTTGTKRPAEVDGDGVLRVSKRTRVQSCYDCQNSTEYPWITPLKREFGDAQLEDGEYDVLPSTSMPHYDSGGLVPTGTLEPVSTNDTSFAALNYCDASARSGFDEPYNVPVFEPGMLGPGLGPCPISTFSDIWSDASCTHLAEVTGPWANLNLVKSSLEVPWPTFESLSEEQEGPSSYENIDLTDRKDDYATITSPIFPSACTETAQFLGTAAHALSYGYNCHVSDEANSISSAPASVSLNGIEGFGGMHTSMRGIGNTSTEVTNEVETISDQDGSKAVEKGPQTVYYYTCFGVVSYLIVALISSFQECHGGKPVAVTMRRFGDMIRLYYQDTNKYAGLLTIPILGQILDKFSIKFSASLVMSKSQTDRTSGRTKKQSLKQRHECSARIVVYGLKTEEEPVGDLLSDSDLFLQQPSAAECDRNIEYSNPHYLVRPGSTMPRLDELSISTNSPVASASDKIDEATQSRFMHLFDTSCANIQLRITPSPRLHSMLKE